jgi:hypothetical protein
MSDDKLRDSLEDLFSDLSLPGLEGNLEASPLPPRPAEEPLSEPEEELLLPLPLNSQTQSLQMRRRSTRARKRGKGSLRNSSLPQETCKPGGRNCCEEYCAP